MNERSQPDVAQITTNIYNLLRDLDDETRSRIVSAVLALCGQSGGQAQSIITEPSMPTRAPSFGSQEDLSPKEFMKAKSPRLDTERIACLAYYLTYYQDTPHFKTIDLSRLNTASAQLKLTNPAQTVKNATNAGLLADAGKRALKQLSHLGEDYVAALPDREAAKKVMARARKPRKKKTKSKKK